jgi:hypothetical protein
MKWNGKGHHYNTSVNDQTFVSVTHLGEMTENEEFLTVDVPPLSILVDSSKAHSIVNMQMHDRDDPRCQIESHPFFTDSKTHSIVNTQIHDNVGYFYTTRSYYHRNTGVEWIVIEDGQIIEFAFFGRTTTACISMYKCLLRDTINKKETFVTVTLEMVPTVREQAIKLIRSHPFFTDSQTHEIADIKIHESGPWHAAIFGDMGGLSRKDDIEDIIIKNGEVTKFYHHAPTSTACFKHYYCLILSKERRETYVRVTLKQR